jgi:C-terminal processing protease CtpA/Prc
MDEHLSKLGVTPLQPYASGKISYAALPDGRGYLRINTFDGYRKNDRSSAASSAELARVLDSVFTEQSVHAMRGLVIDLRLNSGGDDTLGLQVAARLTDRPYLAFTKEARNDPRDITKHGRAQQVTVTPAAGPRYTGPVWLLTSDSTLSAGEAFIEALMGRAPVPVRVGATTQGVFSDDMSRKLPNGWTFTLGNEEYTASDGHNYEGEGIPPTISTPVLTQAEIDGGMDSALDAAH